MGRTPCCDKNNGLKKGPWTPEEDQKLVDYIQKHGCGNWRTLPKNAGLQRCGKSCRLRWTNYLRPDIKRGRFSFEEEETIIQLHSILGNKWSAIASRLPGRTDNEIKNYWNTHIRKRLLRMGIDPVTHSPRLDLLDLSSVLYGSSLSQMNILGMHQQPLVNPALLKLASSLFSSSHQNRTTHQEINNHILCNPGQIQNYHIPQELPQEGSCGPDCGTLLSTSDCVSMPPFTQAQFVELETNVDPYPPNFNDDFGSPSPQEHHHSQPQLMSDWHTNGIAASSSPYATQLIPSYDEYYDYNNCCSDDHHANNLMDPHAASETSTFQCSNNSNHQNFSRFANSVLSTPSSSPKPLNSNSTYVNGSCTTEVERESYVVSSSSIMRFEIPDHLLDLNEFMYVM